MTTKGHIYVIDDDAAMRDSLNFLLDSGANVSVIHLAVAKRLGLKPGERVSVRGVQALSEGYWPQRREQIAATADRRAARAEAHARAPIPGA